MKGWEGGGGGNDISSVMIGLVEVARARGRPQMEGGLEVIAWVVKRNWKPRARILLPLP